MNIFNTIKVYAAWSVKEERTFSAEEIAEVKQAVVVPGDYGNSVQLELKRGGKAFINVDSRSDVGVGELVDLSKAKLVTLQKEGAGDIYKILV